jgi:hypothetical protein
MNLTKSMPLKKLKKTESRMDDLIHTLYGLSEEQASLVEGNSGRFPLSRE